MRQAGGLCIVDEIQTGFGRAGDYFWIFETQGKPIQRRERKKEFVEFFH